MTDNAQAPRWIHYRSQTGSRWGAFVLATAGLLVLGVIVNSILPVARVGDGMEYYALFYAWTDTLRPWMTDTSYALYQRLHESGGIIGTLDRSYLEAAFPALRLGETSDFNHFWFYSFLAAAARIPFAILGIDIGAHGSFLLLHAIIFIGLLSVAYLCHGWRGFWTVIVLTLGSPIVWYFNKVHTEFLTFCVTLVGIVLAMRNQLIAGALLMAVAATQNPGLSFVPVVMIGLRGLSDWSVPYSRWEVAGAVVTVLLLAAHPAYYFLRYEVITPQLLAGGAAPGAGLSIAYIWLFDPDVGLFPNWPLGLALILLGAVWWKSSGVKDGRIQPVKPWHLWTVIAVFFAVSMYSHASTENLNSGATPGLARYALWYIPLVYPFALAVVVAIDTMGKTKRLIAGAALWTAVIATGATYLSVKWESYTKPSILSRLVQTHTPWLYTPPAEIFGERFSGYGDNLYAMVAVVGPDCRKTLLLPPPADERVIIVSDRCAFDGEQIRDWVATERAAITAPTFVELAQDGIKEPEPTLMNHRYPHDSAAETVRMTGWSGIEPQHRWSDGPSSSIGIVLPPAGETDRCLVVDGFTYGAQTISVSIDGSVVAENSLNGEGVLTVPLGRREGPTRVDLVYSDPRMPPTDPRSLAFGLRSFEISDCL